MQYVKFGNTGMDVSRICLGMMSFGKPGKENGVFPWARDYDDAKPLFKKAIDLGINYFDTANVYQMGSSEEITGRLVRDFGLDRDEIVVATKVHFDMRPGKPNGITAERDAPVAKRSGRVSAKRELRSSRTAPREGRAKRGDSRGEAECRAARRARTSWRKSTTRSSASAWSTSISTRYTASTRTRRWRRSWPHDGAGIACVDALEAGNHRPHRRLDIGEAHRRHQDRSVLGLRNWHNLKVPLPNYARICYNIGHEN